MQRITDHLISLYPTVTSLLSVLFFQEIIECSVGTLNFDGDPFLGILSGTSDKCHFSLTSPLLPVLRSSVHMEDQKDGS